MFNDGLRSVTKEVRERKKVRAGRTQTLCDKMYGLSFLKWAVFGSRMPDLWSYISNFPSTKSRLNMVSEPLHWLIEQLMFGPDEVTLWAAAASRKRPFFVSADQTFSQKPYRNKSPTRTPTYALCRHRQGLSLLWHYQQSTSWPPTKVKAVITDRTLSWAFKLTVQSHSPCQPASLQPRWRGVVPNDLQTALTFRELYVLLSPSSLYVMHVAFFL